MKMVNVLLSHRKVRSGGVKMAGKNTKPNGLHVGKRLFNTEGQEFEVVEYLGSRKVACVFLVSGFKTGYLQAGNVVRGRVKDMLSPSVQGIGFLGAGDAPTRDGRTGHPIYVAWCGMFERCYSEKYHLTRPTYRGCSVAEDWHNYQVFYKWAVTRYRKGYHLDKDILVQGNKVYSPYTCCFVPQAVNSLVSVVLKGDCSLGVSKRKKKGTTEFNGRYNVNTSSCYLGRFDCEKEAAACYKEYKEFLFQETATILLERNIIPTNVAEALFSRVVK